ncbi:unnamed protein product [Rangifer tarandus platyrhynchus]|uniref:Uncharacterized protein n=1 Tax=Rangifer tarandus platyrhynchus TaxID=3082113 RepID=A0AC59Y9W4_RANTA
MTKEERGGNWEVKWAFRDSSGQEAQCVCQKGTGAWCFLHVARSWTWPLFLARSCAHSSASCVPQPPLGGPLQLSIWSAQPARTGEDALGRIKVVMQNRSKLFKQQTPSRGPCLESWLTAEVSGSVPAGRALVRQTQSGRELSHRRAQQPFSVRGC